MKPKEAERPVEKMDRWIVASVALHVAVVLGVFVAPGLFQAKGASWGSNTGGNGGVNVKIVSNMSGIALPTPVVTSDDAVANNSKALYKAESEPKVKAPATPDPDAIKLQSKTAPKKPAPVVPAKPVKTASVSPSPAAPSNAVTYGQGGGQPNMRYGQTAPGTGPTGADFGGNGTFGNQFGTYVDTMTRIITDAWLGINVGQLRSPRVYVTFTIARDGSVSNVALEKPNGSPTPMESAALQAVRRARLTPLPSTYSGSTVDVRFYFDYAK